MQIYAIYAYIEILFPGSWILRFFVIICLDRPADTLPYKWSPWSRFANDRSKVASLARGQNIAKVLFDVVERLMGEERESVIQVDGMSRLDDIEVDSVIMIVFTALNLVADMVVAVCAWRCGASELLGEEASNMNLFGALAHLGADMVRGLAVLLAGILAQAKVVEASKADAYCSLFVCIFVLMATASLLRTLLQQSNPLAYAHVEFDNEREAREEPAAPAQNQQPEREAPEHQSSHGQAMAKCIGKALSSDSSPEALPDGIWGETFSCFGGCVRNVPSFFHTSSIRYLTTSLMPLKICFFNVGFQCFPFTSFVYLLYLS